MIYHKIYLLKTLNVKNSQSKILDKEVDDVMLTRLAKLLDIEDDKNIAVGINDGAEFMFMKLSEDKVFKINNLMSEYFDTDLIEVTEDIIVGVLDEYKKVHNGPYYKEFLTEFRLSNTKVDDVLDKINAYGLDSLDDLDKLILVK